MSGMMELWNIGIMVQADEDATLHPRDIIKSHTFPWTFCNISDIVRDKQYLWIQLSTILMSEVIPRSNNLELRRVWDI